MANAANAGQVVKCAKCGHMTTRRTVVKTSELGHRYFNSLDYSEQETQA